MSVVEPVECQYSAWSWQTCTETCGGGTEVGTRTIIREPLHGGQECSGDISASRVCNIGPCPGNSNIFQVL